MKKKSADLISRITQYMKDNPTVANWINLMVSIIIAVIIVLILLKIERKITRKWIDKHDGINARFTEKVIRCVIRSAFFFFIRVSPPAPVCTGFQASLNPRVSAL